MSIKDDMLSLAWASGLWGQEAFAQLQNVVYAELDDAQVQEIYGPTQSFIGTMNDAGQDVLAEMGASSTYDFSGNDDLIAEFYSQLGKDTAGNVAYGVLESTLRRYDFVFQPDPLGWMSTNSGAYFWLVPSEWFPPQISYSTARGTAPAPIDFDPEEGYVLTAADLPALTASGYRFDGWFYESTYDTEAQVDDEIWESTTLYAKWVRLCNITYSTTYGTAPSVKTVDYGYTVTSADLPALPDASGYRFDGWYLDSRFRTKVTVGYRIISSWIFYAKWVSNTVTLSYDSDYGDTPQSKSVAVGYALAAADLPVLVDSHGEAIFDGWYYDTALTNKAAVGNTISQATTLYAKWLLVCTVSYNSAHGNPPAAQQVEEGYTLKSTDLPALSENGYRFDGWYYESTFTTLAHAGDSITTDRTLYAKWTELVTVSYSTPRGTAPASVTVPVGYTLTAADLPALTDASYSFDGWYKTSGLQTRAQVGDSVTKSMTLYAKWTKTITLHYASEYATPPADKTITFEGGYALTAADLPALTSPDANFVGWDHIVGEVVTDNTTITAQWSALDTYAITYNDPKGQVIQPVTLEQGEPITAEMLPALSHAPWTFTGWFYEDGRLAAVGDAVTANTVLTAGWDGVTVIDVDIIHADLTLRFNTRGDH